MRPYCNEFTLFIIHHNKYIPQGGFHHYKNIDIINARCPGMAGTTPGRANPNREIKAGKNIIHCPAEKRKDKI
jgi:hypothetical protein